MGKGIKGEDLLERKVTLMVIHCCRERRNMEFLRLFMNATKSASDIDRMIQLLTDGGSIAYAEAICERHAKQTTAVLTGIPSSERLREL